MNAATAGNPGIIILGMHRGGTSLAAELVQKWGAYGDEPTMTPADASNPRGYWEHAPLVRFNDELLAMVQSRWNVPPSAEAKSSLAAMAEDSEFRRRALNLLAGIRASGRPWFWKDPRLSILLPFWKRFWRDILFVIPVRDPGDIARSLRHRYGFSLGHSLLLWHTYMLDILEDEQVRSTGIFLVYEDLIGDPRKECARLCRTLDEHAGTSASYLPDRDRRLDRMIEAVDPALWRSRDDSRFSQNPLASQAQRALYRALVLQSKGEPPTCSADFALEAHWRQTLVTEDLLHRLGIASARCQVFWRVSPKEYTEDCSQSVRVVMDSTPQRIRISVPRSQDSGEVGIRVDLADRPALVWLTGLTLRDSAENFLWAWDGRAESLAGFAQNDIAFCRPLTGESGCVLWLDGFDPWIEITFTRSQSAALLDGVLLELCGTYSASFEQDFLRTVYASSCNTLGFVRPDIRQDEAHGRNLEPLKRLEDPHTQLQRETLHLLQTLEKRQTEVHLLVHGILRSRIWRTMVGMGGLALGAKLILERACGTLSRSFRRP